MKKKSLIILITLLILICITFTVVLIINIRVNTNKTSPNSIELNQTSIDYDNEKWITDINENCSKYPTEQKQICISLSNNNSILEIDMLHDVSDLGSGTSILRERYENSKLITLENGAQILRNNFVEPTDDSEQNIYGTQLIFIHDLKRDFGQDDYMIGSGSAYSKKLKNNQHISITYKFNRVLPS